MHQKQNTRNVSMTVSATPPKVHSFFSLIKLIAQTCPLPGKILKYIDSKTS